VVSWLKLFKLEDRALGSVARRMDDSAPINARVLQSHASDLLSSVRRRSVMTRMRASGSCSISHLAIKAPSGCSFAAPWVCSDTASTHLAIAFLCCSRRRN